VSERLITLDAWAARRYADKVPGEIYFGDTLLCVAMRNRGRADSARQCGMDEILAAVARRKDAIERECRDRIEGIECIQTADWQRSCYQMLANYSDGQNAHIVELEQSLVAMRERVRQLADEVRPGAATYSGVSLAARLDDIAKEPT
jgi:hypothetical protein